MDRTVNLQLLEELNEASAQLLGALNEDDWALAQQLSDHRQALTLKIAPDKQDATAEFEQAWHRHLLLEQQLRAALESHQVKLQSKVNVKSRLKTKRGIKQYQTPTSDQTD